MSSWGYVTLGYVLTFLVLAAFAWRSEARIARLRKALRGGGRRP